MIKLIATDMDGTLLDERGETSSGKHHLTAGFALSSDGEMKSIACASSFWVPLSRVTLVSRQGSSIFENDQMVLGKILDRELVEAVLDYFKAEISDQLVVSAVNGGLCLAKANGLAVEKFKRPK